MEEFLFVVVYFLNVVFFVLLVVVYVVNNFLEFLLKFKGDGIIVVVVEVNGVNQFFENVQLVLCGGGIVYVYWLVVLVIFEMFQVVFFQVVCIVYFVDQVQIVGMVEFFVVVNNLVDESLGFILEFQLQEGVYGKG